MSATHDALFHRAASSGLSRRTLLRAAIAAGAGAAVVPYGRRLADAEEVATFLGVSFDPAPFTLGVMSADPTPEGVLIWTRVAPEPLLDRGHDGSLPDRVPVAWVVAEDPAFRRIVASGEAVADAAVHHTVTVDVGGLDPATTYWYRFAALGGRSRIGRTRTAPMPDDPRPVRLAWVGCQKFHEGYFTAYDHLVREDVDLVLCTGDYIYEEGFSETSSRDFRVEQDPSETITLDEYRARYTIYRGDSKLRLAHAMFPWVVTWDDHEVDNNYAGLIPEEDTKHPEVDLAVRRADAYRAHWEYLPGRTNPPEGPDYQIYRRMRYGLIDLLVTDTRQYRDDQPCGDEETRSNPTGLPIAYCEGFNDPDATILGTDQRQWLKDELGASTAPWRVLLNAVMVGSLRIASLPDSMADLIRPGGEIIGIGDGSYINPDQWDGYPADRSDLLQHLADNGITDTVVLTGDIHSNWIHDLNPDADDPSSPAVATEFVGTSITSNGFSAEEEAAFRIGLYATHDHLRWMEGKQRGYSVATITPDEWITTFVAVDTIREERSPASVLGVWRVPRGRAGADPIQATDTNPLPPIRP